MQWSQKKDGETEAQYFLRVYGLKNKDKWVNKYKYSGPKKKVQIRLIGILVIVLVGTIFIIKNTKLWSPVNQETRVIEQTEINTYDPEIAIQETVKTTEIIGIVLNTPAAASTLTPYPTYTPYPTAIAGRNIDWSIGLPGDYDTSTWQDVKVKVSWYFPPYGGINIHGDGIYMANGERWQDWVGKAVACPASWKLGSLLSVGGYTFECKDRGGSINCDGDGCWIDVLYPYNVFENTYWGTILDAKILYPD